MVGMRRDECHTAQCTVRCHHRMGDMQAPTEACASTQDAPEPTMKAPGGASSGSQGATPASKTADVDREPVYAKLKQVQHLLVQLSRCAKEGMMVLPPKQLEQVSTQHLPAMCSAWLQADLAPVYQLPAALREAGRPGPGSMLARAVQALLVLLHAGSMQPPLSVPVQELNDDWFMLGSSFWSLVCELQV